ncbi:MAG: DUF5615 family PIN-like protein [Gracilimonas sp.]
MKFYFDENITPQIARALAILQEPRQNEKIEVYTIRDAFGKGAPDEEWIPKVAAEDGIVVTQDMNIHRTRHQRELYRQHGLGVVFFKPPSKSGYSYWEMIEKLIEAWPQIKKIGKTERKPFAFIIKPRSKKVDRL